MAARRRFPFAERAAFACVAAVAFPLVSACNGVLGIPEVEHLASAGSDGGSGSCPPGQKSCGGVCVSLGDPSSGCAAVDCRPCALAHAKVACVEGACAIEVCEEGFGNCNAQRADGCEVDLRSDGKNCNACGNDCQGFGCANSGCVCTDAFSCGFGGTCDRQRACNCGGTPCSSGAACTDTDTCQF